MIKRVEVTLTRAGTTGFATPAAVPELGQRGYIQRVVVREDVTLDDATAAVVYIATDALTSAPVAGSVVYESASITLTGSATASSGSDWLASAGPGSAYDVAAGASLNVGANITATAGGTTTALIVTIWADVEE